MDRMPFQRHQPVPDTLKEGRTLSFLGAVMPSEISPNQSVYATPRDLRQTY